MIGAIAGVIAWVGWLTTCPALGLPSLSAAAMLNRVLVPREDPGSWLGWALLVIGLMSAALFYLAAVMRGRLRPSIASGALYGAICWLLAGAVLMPLLGLAAPLPPIAAGAPPPAPDPMHGSFMMLHLGLAAPLTALVGWLIFGAVLGASANARSTDTMAIEPKSERALATPALGAAVVIVALLGIGLVVSRLGGTAAGPTVTSSRTLATGPVAAVPPGTLFMSIIEIPQAPGGVLGPHAHIPGFAYSLHGVATLDFAGGQAVRVGPGEAGFMAAQAPHTHLNADDHGPAAALALLIVELAVAVCLLRFRPSPRTARLLPVALVLLIAAGGLATWNPWTNDWFFLSVRPVATRGGPMPMATASRTYESPDLGALPAAPYAETLDEITVVPGASGHDVGSAGAAVLFVLDGRVTVQPAGGPQVELVARASTLLQPGTSVRLITTGDKPAHVLRFAIAPPPGA